ncbi:MAG: MarR family transcriptional regulator, partial [Deltaproteobacteria bacterium]|nr:MarR family transcriptional regulator [Deltaproteobacteria bacterium]
SVMEKNITKTNEELLYYQVQRFKKLISAILQHSKDRRWHQRQILNVHEAKLKCLMLFDGERYLTPTGIAKKLLVGKSRVTKIIKGLIDKGMIKQLSDPMDARVKLICLTSIGQKNK